LNNNDSKLSAKEKLGYGLGDTASNLYWQMFTFYLVYFYTEVIGVAAGVVATMMLVTRFWDAINDPLLGSIADRTKTAWGRFRPYLLWMAFPFAITGILTFYIPDISENGKIIYIYVTYTLVMMAYTAINIPYGALLGVISPDSGERTSASTYRFIAAFIGAIIVQYGTLKLVRVFGGSKQIIVDGIEKTVTANEQAGFFWTMVVYACTAFVLFLITFATTRERVTPDVKQKTNLKLDLKDLLSNRPWLVMFGFGMLQLSSIFVRGGVIVFYFKYFVQADGEAFSFLGLEFEGWEALSSAFLVIGSFAAIAGMLFTKAWTNIFGKKWLMILMTLINSAIMAFFLFLKPDQIGLMFALHIIASFINGPSPVLVWAMYADTADYSEWKNDRRATGLIFSAATFSQKMGCMVGGALTPALLKYFDYVSPQQGTEIVQAEQTVYGIVLMMSVIPAGFAFLAAGVMLFYSIDKKLIRQIEADLRQRKSKSVAPQT
jgi:GPH family glycoside/pentoside/hexuronide:cation symporter